MDVKIAGHSGCSITVMRESGTLCIHKLTQDAKYVARLLAQADKQERFLQINRFPGITAPAVLRRIREPENGGMVMEFVHGRTFIDYFENASCAAPAHFVERMTGFLEMEFADSPVQDVPSTLLMEKFASVERNIMASPFLSRDTEITKLLKAAKPVFARPEVRRWPVGRCHGDLTLSNLLFQDDKIYLIDFLDSFIETPLMDLVKLRQDTRYGWSRMLCHGSFDEIKNRIVMEYMDELLWTHFRQKPDVAEGYFELQCMNFLRILQYAHAPLIIAYLKKHLRELLAEGVAA